MTVKDTYFCTFHKFRPTVNRIEIISTSLNPRLGKLRKLFQQLHSEKKKLIYSLRRNNLVESDDVKAMKINMPQES